jgi:hypothetical protein
MTFILGASLTVNIFLLFKLYEQSELLDAVLGQHDSDPEAKE